MVVRKYAIVKDKVDKRDHKVHKSKRFSLINPAEVPVTFNTVKWCSPVEDQGELGACSMHAFACALELLENKQNEFLDNGQFVRVSRLMGYYNERLLEGDIDDDGGAELRDGIATLAKYGICKEDIWPYDIAKFKLQPPLEAYVDGLNRRITSYARVDTTNNAQVEQVIASGYPIVIGIQIYDSFETEEVARTGVVSLPLANEKCLGGHAVTIVAYDRTTQRYLVRNSWGPNWGFGGYFTIPYAYINNPNLCGDAWVINN